MLTFDSLGVQLLHIETHKTGPTKTTVLVSRGSYGARDDGQLDDPKADRTILNEQEKSNSW